MTEKKQFPWLPVIIGVGCVGILCVGVLVVVSAAAFFLTVRSDSSYGPEAVVTVEVEVATVVPELIDIPTIEPTTVSEPTATAISLTGNQRLDDHSLYDDFSSDALRWPVYDDGKTILKYEDETYSFQIAEPEYIDWAYFPVDFVPYEIWFDAQGQPDSQDGTFGVFCQYQDVDNHYYVELDLGSKSYIIAQYLDGEDIALTKQNTVGQFWYESDAFNPSPNDINRIGVGCYLEEITLFINDQLVDQVNVEQSFDQPGEAAFFVYAFSYAGPEGYKVFFDNVEVWQPVQ